MTAMRVKLYAPTELSRVQEDVIEEVPVTVELQVSRDDIMMPCDGYQELGDGKYPWITAIRKLRDYISIRKQSKAIDVLNNASVSVTYEYWNAVKTAVSQPTRTVNYVTVEYDKLNEELWMSRDFLQAYMNTGIDRIIVGPRNIHIWHEHKLEYPVGFMSTMRVPDMQGRVQHKFDDIYIQIVPWFDGVLVVPKDNK